jgi:hypothetical protein
MERRCIAPAPHCMLDTATPPTGGLATNRNGAQKVRTPLCLQLPSDSQTPATPLPFGYHFLLSRVE